jgi:threonine dehydrogenase-like Zn-dependent dehydrogenase
VAQVAHVSRRVDEAEEAYRLFDARQATKIVLTP